jgi:hypothetical protein
MIIDLKGVININWKVIIVYLLITRWYIVMTYEWQRYGRIRSLVDEAFIDWINQVGPIKIWQFVYKWILLSANRDSSFNNLSSEDCHLSRKRILFSFGQPRSFFYLYWLHSRLIILNIKNDKLSLIFIALKCHNDLDINVYNTIKSLVINCIQKWHQYVI